MIVYGIEFCLSDKYVIQLSDIINCITAIATFGLAIFAIFQIRGIKNGNKNVIKTNLTNYDLVKLLFYKLKKYKMEELREKIYKEQFWEYGYNNGCEKANEILKSIENISKNPQISDAIQQLFPRLSD